MTSQRNHSQDSGALYLVFCGRHIPEYTPEREVRDMTWAGTVKDIADLQFPSLTRVVEIGTGRDVTAEMMVDVGELVALTYPNSAADAPLTGQNKIEWLNDHRRDQRKHERV